MFICNHCPFVKHLKRDIVKITNYYMKVKLLSCLFPSLFVDWIALPSTLVQLNSCDWNNMLIVIDMYIVCGAERTCGGCNFFKLCCYSSTGSDDLVSSNWAVLKPFNDSSPALTYSSQDGPEFMAEDAKTFKYPFPYLYDEVSIFLSFF